MWTNLFQVMKCSHCAREFCANSAIQHFVDDYVENVTTSRRRNLELGDIRESSRNSEDRDINKREEEGATSHQEPKSPSTYSSFDSFSRKVRVPSAFLPMQHQGSSSSPSTSLSKNSEKLDISKNTRALQDEVITPTITDFDTLRQFAASSTDVRLNECHDKCTTDEFFCKDTRDDNYDCLKQCISECLCDTYCEGFIEDAGNCVEQGGKWLILSLNI